ncbi:MAG TPA: HNH endonuclease family protein [Jiangellaceae bacterium]|nr:HNH endonuclease family protein [Jiangellaceae bacterium]
MRKPLATITAAALTAAIAYTLHTNAQDDTPTHELLNTITIAPEDASYDYVRDEWPHWSYVGDYCDIRDVVLQKQAEQVRVGEKCALSGTWVSPYDDVTVTDPSDLDIDHVIPLAEVAASGSRGWSEAEREAFANDERFLLAVTASSNRSKSDADPAEWMPTDTSYHCEYLHLWVDAKHAYNLTMDQKEHNAVARGLNRC